MWQMPQAWPQLAERHLQSVGLLSSTCNWILRPVLSLGMSTLSMHPNPSYDLCHAVWRDCIAGIAPARSSSDA